MGIENLLRPVHHDVVAYQRKIQTDPRPVYLRYKGAPTKYFLILGAMTAVAANAFYGFGLMALDKPLPKAKSAGGDEE